VSSRARLAARFFGALNVPSTSRERRSVYAESLAEAQCVLEANQKPACIIVDLDLPDGEGIEVLKELDGIPVLALIRSQNVER
jgi:DNA-binding response OmpR family regulator